MKNVFPYIFGNCVSEIVSNNSVNKFNAWEAQAIVYVRFRLALFEAFKCEISHRVLVFLLKNELC